MKEHLTAEDHIMFWCEICVKILNSNCVLYTEEACFHLHSNTVEKNHCKVSPWQLFTMYYQAVETLKTFEKKDSRVKSAAATNLSFLYFLVRPLIT